MDPVKLIEAIVAADGTGKMPPLTTVQLLLQVLGVPDVDEVIAKVTDEQGNWIDTGAAAAAAAVAGQRKPPVPAGRPPADDAA